MSSTGPVFQTRWYSNREVKEHEWHCGPNCRTMLKRKLLLPVGNMIHKRCPPMSGKNGKDSSIYIFIFFIKLNVYYWINSNKY